MAASQTEVVNLALTVLGQDRVTSIDEDVEAARVMKALWNLSRDCVLSEHPWKFAIKRVGLPSLSDAPEGTLWTIQFALPEECLRLVQVAEDWVFYTGDVPSFTIEGRNILCNEASPLFVRYVQRISNVGLWPPMFARAVAMQLAKDGCEKLTGSNSKRETAIAEYELAVRRARRQSAIELPPAREPEAALLRARGD